MRKFKTKKIKPGNFNFKNIKFFVLLLVVARHFQWNNK